ncbi:MAG: hypothetical protein IT380_12335, partial [Myxococcales bacterium]|nr:hypothetical protein [Myxococcales bacterium]
SASNNPGRHEPDEKVRRLQRKLYVAAKQQKERRFHALYDRLCRSDVLREAWERVKRKKGAGGVDGVTLEAVEQYGVEKLLNELRDELHAGEYRAPPVLRRYIPKADGKQRPLGIPTVRDRVVQMAAKLVLEPIFETDFLLERLKLTLHPEKTRRVDLTEGKEGFDFLGNASALKSACMLHREVPPVSRVRETRTHGLKGGGGDRAA